MQRRIFIAINLPQALKNKVLDWRKKGQKLRVSWTKPENMHITLVFMGEIEEYMVDKLLEATRGVVKNFKAFEVSVDRVHTRFAEATRLDSRPASRAKRAARLAARRVGPNLNMPRMIWLSGPENENLFDLARQLADGLKKEGIELKNNHGFKLHITLARARNDELRGVKIDENFEHSFLAESVEVMESRLLPDGPAYSVLERIEFEK